MIKIKNKKLRFVITFLAVLLSALLQTFVIESFVSTLNNCICEAPIETCATYT